MKKILDKYNIKSEGVDINIAISSTPDTFPIYELEIKDVKPATRALLEEIKRELITEVKVTTTEILDPKVMESLKEKFRKKAIELLVKKLPHINEDTKKFLTGLLLQEMLGLEKIEFLLNDPELEEIVVVSSDEPVRVYHKKYGWLETNLIIKNEEKIQNYSNIIARRVGRQITTLSPLLDAHLTTGDRSNAVLYPISTKGNTITIRKFARDPWTVTDFIKNKTCSSTIFALIWLAIQYELNILISGGTASGKTSFLNVCMPFIPPNHRILSIEDTRELQLPKFLYWCPLTVRQPNPEGKGEVSMLDLLVNSLRMRPDRIILGEVRKQRQAEVLFEAMHTGHSVYATVHADSISETIRRLIYPPISVSPNLLSAVDLNVVMFRDRKKGIRRVYQVGEFMVSEEAKEVIVKPNILYRWVPRKDQIVAHATSLKLFEDLSRHTGMSQSEITKEINSRKKILEWMVKNNIRDIHSIGKLFKEYYLDSEKVKDMADKNKKFGPFLK